MRECRESRTGGSAEKLPGVGEVKNEVMEMLKEVAHYGRMFSENDN